MDVRQRAEDALAKLDEFVNVHVPDLRAELVKLLGRDDPAPDGTTAADTDASSGSEADAGDPAPKRGPRKAPASTGGS